MRVNKIILFLLMLSMLEPVYPASTDTLYTNNQRKKVGLVLSGGGAKGAAHIGVLKALEAQGVPIDYIAGTSMGAIVGGLYAIGYSPAKIDSIFKSQDWTALLTDKISRNKLLFSEKENSDKTILSVPFTKENIELRTGLLSGGAVLNMLTLFTSGYHDMQSFDSLPIPFACVAYDLDSGEEVVMRSGNLATAIRASMSIPGAFTTVQRDGHILVDGGVINNFPVDVVRQMGAEIIIGVDVSLLTEERQKEERNSEETSFGSLAYISQKLIDRMGEEKFFDNLGNTDLYIHPQILPYTTTSFYNQAIDSLIQRGERATLQKTDSLEVLKRKIFGDGASQEYSLPAYRDLGIDYPIPDSVNIGKIFFSGIGLLNEANLQNMLRFKENSRISLEQIIEGMERLRGTGMFSDVWYELNNYKRDAYDLIINCKEQSQNAVNAGIRFNTMDISSGYLNAIVVPRNFNGVSFEFSGRLSSNPYTSLNIYYQNAWLGKFGISHQFKKGDFDVHTGVDPIDMNASFVLHSFNLDIANFYYRNFNFYLKIRYEHFVPGSSELFRRDARYLDQGKENTLIYNGGVTFDNFDHAYYPHTGIKFTSNLSVYTDNFSNYKGGNPYISLYTSFQGAIPASSRFTILPGISSRVVNDERASFQHKNFIGGVIPDYYMSNQIPFIGLNSIAIVAKRVTIANLEFRYRIGSNHYVWAKTNAAIINDTFRDTFDMQTGDYLFGAALGYSFDNPLGPLDIMINFSNYKGSRKGFYLNLGKYF